MAHKSASEFPTLYRRLTTSQSIKCVSVSRATVRPFSSSVSQWLQSEKKKDIGDAAQQKKHILEKDEEPNVQAYESKAGRANRAQGSGGAATEQKDPGNSATKKAKEEFPEAPTTIGFQDERGGKGL